MTRYELRYIPGSPLGAKFPLWRFGQRTTRESADATRMQCATPDQIEVVKCGESPDRVADSGSTYETISGSPGPQNRRPGPSPQNEGTGPTITHCLKAK